VALAHGDDRSTLAGNHCCGGGACHSCDLPAVWPAHLRRQGKGTQVTPVFKDLQQMLQLQWAALLTTLATHESSPSQAAVVTGLVEACTRKYTGRVQEEAAC